ncbi:bifunctional DNA primase/polymerase [Gordonia sp. NPDC003429]
MSIPNVSFDTADDEGRPPTEKVSRDSESPDEPTRETGVPAAERAREGLNGTSAASATPRGSTRRGRYDRLSPDDFVEHAKRLLDTGWHPIPLGDGRGDKKGKALLVSGVTGHEGADVQQISTLRTWAEKYALRPGGLNLGTRMPLGVCGIDVDCYDGKPGSETIAQAEAEWGQLPATWSLTARTDGSRKLFYRVPEGWAGPGVLAGGGVELLQRHHRYAVVPPSIHHSGNQVRVFDPEGHESEFLPSPSELPELPVSWVNGLRHDAEGLSKGTVVEGRRLRNRFQSGAMSPEVAEQVNKVLDAVDDGASRFDTCRQATFALVALGAEGHSGVVPALQIIEREYLAALGPERGDATTREEFDRLVNGALRKVAANHPAATMTADDRALVTAAFAPGGMWHPDNPKGNVYRLRRGMKTDSQPQAGSIFTLLSADQWASPVPKPRFLIRGVLVEDTFGVVAGPKKSLKTHENQAIALAVSTGKALYGHERFAVDGMHPVLYIVGEGGQADVRRKLQRMCRAYGIDPAEVMRDPTFPLRAAFGAAPMNDPRFNDELKRMLDVAQPELVLIESFYNFHPADVEASNLYQRGQALDRFHKFVRAECEGATSLMTDHYRSTASKGNDLDLISMAGQAENADSWITRHHREPADVEKGDFRLRVSYNSRQWGGREYDIDWHLGQFDPDTGTHDGEIRWSVHEDAGRSASQGGLAGPDPKTSDGRKALILEWIPSHPEMSKTSSIEALAIQHGAHEKRFREAWSALEGERRIQQVQVNQEYPYNESTRTRKVKVWKVMGSGYVLGASAEI